MRITVNSNAAKVRGYPAKLTQAIDQAIVETAMQVAQDARDGAPVDTSALRESIVVIAPRSSLSSVTTDVEQAKARAEALRPGVEFDEPPIPEKPNQAFVAALVSYAKYVEANHPTARFFMAKARRRNERTLRTKLQRAIRSIR